MALGLESWEDFGRVKELGFLKMVGRVEMGVVFIEKIEGRVERNFVDGGEEEESGNGDCEKESGCAIVVVEVIEV